MFFISFLESVESESPAGRMPAKGEPAQGDVPGLELDDEDALGQAGDASLHAFHSWREGQEVEDRQRERDRPSDDEPASYGAPIGHATEGKTDHGKADDRGQGQHEAGEVKEK